MNLWDRLSAAACVAMLSAACGSSESSDEPQACVPNASASCTGPGSCSGYQVCNPDGSGYSACDCSGSGGAGGSAGAAGAPSVCPKGLKGPELVELQSPNGTRYCIDATEVTFAQYDEFLAAGVDTSQAPEPCQNTPLEYDLPVYPDCLAGLDKIPDAPARCVLGCAAREYCRWAGKRLCGRIGGGPIYAFGDDPEDPNVSQWFNACSAGGKQDYAYGDIEKEECNASRNSIGTVTTPAGCESTVAPVFGLLSNAAEWEDACAPGSAGSCKFLVRPNGSTHPTCKNRGSDQMGRFIGFRCCHDGKNP